MIVGFYFEAFFFLLVVHHYVEIPFPIPSQTNEHAGMWCISGLISSASLSWRCLPLSKLHREILDYLSTHLDVLLFCFCFGFFNLRLMLLQTFTSFSILLPKRLVSFCLLLSSVSFCPLLALCSLVNVVSNKYLLLC